MCRTKCQVPQNGHGQKTDRDTDRETDRGMDRGTDMDMSTDRDRETGRGKCHTSKAFFFGC
jgi:hypothetical protein